MRDPLSRRSSIRPPATTYARSRRHSCGLGNDFILGSAFMHIRLGRTTERSALESLQFRAATASPVYREAILQHPDSIALSPALLADGRVRVAEMNDTIVGFSVLIAPFADAAELDGLFVDPARWRRGIGTALLTDAATQARAENARTIEVTANPLAVGFYRKFGFVDLHETQTRFGSARRMRYYLGGNPSLQRLPSPS
jgi:GNAT superfamily N-acetyltransferase